MIYVDCFNVYGDCFQRNINILKWYLGGSFLGSNVQKGAWSGFVGKEREKKKNVVLGNMLCFKKKFDNKKS